VLEQNLDANGFIKVHEQGIAPVAGALAWGFDLGSSTYTHMVPLSGMYVGC
jgi:hypothetical protein